MLYYENGVLITFINKCANTIHRFANAWVSPNGPQPAHFPDGRPSKEPSKAGYFLPPPLILPPEKRIYTFAELSKYYREIFSKYYQINPKLDFIYHAPIDLEQQTDTYQFALFQINWKKVNTI